MSTSPEEKKNQFADPVRARRALLLVAMLVLLFYPLFQFLSIGTEFGFRFNQFRLDLYDYQLRAAAFLTRNQMVERKQPDQVVVVGIDEQAIQRRGRWPWNRSRIGRLIHGLDDLGAKVVAVDILFSEKEETPLEKVDKILTRISPDSSETLLRLSQDVDALLSPEGGGELSEEEADQALETLWEEGILPPEFLLRPDSEDQALAASCRKAGNVIFGTAVEWEKSYQGYGSWVDPAEGSLPPPAAVERIRAQLPELTEAEILEDWKVKAFPKRFLEDAKGIPVVPVGGHGEETVAEILKRHPGIRAKLHFTTVDLYSETGDRVIGIYVPRGLLLGAARSAGYLNDERTADGVVRKFGLARSIQGRALPSLSLSALSEYLEVDPEIWFDENTRVSELRFYRRKDRSLLFTYPTDAQANAWVFPYPTGNHELPGGGEYAHLKSVSAETVLRYLDHELSSEEIQKLKNSIEGKIVLLGVTALGLTDVRISALGDSAPGVENHATVISNILGNESLQWGEREKLLTWNISAFCVLVCSLVLLAANPSVAFVALLFLLAFAFSVTVGLLFVGQIVFCLDIFAPLLSFFLFAVLYLNRFENKEKAWIDQMFKRYVSADYVEQIKKNKGQLDLRGKEKEITPFFSDMAGFSTISEGFESHRLFTFLGEYLGEMTRILDKWGGTLDKFEGDAVCAFFGAPIEFDDHAMRAAKASLEMQMRIREMNREWQTTQRYPELHELAEKLGYWKPIQVRIGLNTGICALGHLGTAERGNYTMMGDHVNLAARLEGAGKQYGITITVSETTAAAVESDILVREVDRIRVVGKTVPTTIFEVIGMKEGATLKVAEQRNHYRQCLQLYKDREYDKAKKSFEEHLHRYGEDKVSQIYIERCEVFLENPPAEDWDGVFDLTSK